MKMDIEKKFFANLAHGGYLGFFGASWLIAFGSLKYYISSFKKVYSFFKDSWWIYESRNGAQFFSVS